MMNQKQLVYTTLDKLQIPYEAVEHSAVFTVEEMKQLRFPPGAVIAKNLFLRDAKGTHHFLICADCDQQIDLKTLHERLGSTKLSFASEQRLQTYLQLEKGHVSPLGLLNDTAHSVTFFLDESLRSAPLIGVHPNHNTATVLLTPHSLITLVEATGHTVQFLRF